MSQRKKTSSKTSSHHVLRNASLVKQLEDDAVVKPTGRVKKRKADDEDEKFVDAKLSRKILAQARKQQAAVEGEDDINKPGGSKSFRLKDTKPGYDSGEDVESEVDQEEDGHHDDQIFYDDIKVSEEDERALEKFMSRNEPKRKTLADLIQEKLREKELEVETQFSDASLKVSDFDERVVEMYRGVKQILARYRSGKLPKAFKIIPALVNWEQVLNLTDPDSWTAAAMYQGTRIFTSNLKEKLAQRFLNLILLPRIRDDIAEYKQLNFHLYQALRKALFKPGAFFKGMILPLCEAGDCTLREALIFSSVMAKNHIPLLHSCAAMLKIAEMDYSGANTVFLYTLIRKKYTLPYRVIDALVYHFLKFSNDKRTLPVLWHQCLLIFVQNYKQDLASDQKEALLELLRVQSHYQITPEIRNELFNSKSRDEEMDTGASASVSINGCSGDESSNAS